jgi:phage terminase small subunit
MAINPIAIKERQRILKEKLPIIEKAEKEKRLTHKQAIFVKEYINTGNGTKSAMKAYDTSYANGTVMASDNLRKPCISRILADKEDLLDSHLLHLSVKARSEQTQFNATALSLAYIRGKPKDCLDVNVTNNINIQALLMRISDTVPTPAESED